MRLFQEYHYETTRNVKRNLDGLTHYYSDDTMQYFKSRILHDVITDGGLLLGTVESFINADGNRRFRSVIFNVFGTVVNDREDQFTNKKKAVENLWIELNSMNAKKITRDGIKHLQETVKRDIKQLRLEMRGIK